MKTKEFMRVNRIAFVGTLTVGIIFIIFFLFGEESKYLQTMSVKHSLVVFLSYCYMLVAVFCWFNMAYSIINIFKNRQHGIKFSYIDIIMLPFASAHRLSSKYLTEDGVIHRNRALKYAVTFILLCLIPYFISR